jgi:hypothetical protein
MLDSFSRLLSFEALPESVRVVPLAALIVIAALLGVGFVRGPYQPARWGRIPKAFELPQSFILIGVAAVIWLTAGQNTPLAGMALCFLIGMVFGWLGDLFMANVFKQKDHVLFGMGAFAVGHIFYMLAFAQIAGPFSYGRAEAYLFGLLATEGVAVVLWRVLVYRLDGDKLQYAALGYGVFLAAMAGFALAIALHEPLFLALAAGAGLFLLSDTLLAADLFAQRRFPFMGDVIWGTYIAAQALIVCSGSVALSLLSSNLS